MTAPDERLFVVSRTVLAKCYDDGWNACAAAFDGKPNVPTFEEWFAANITSVKSEDEVR